MNLKINHYDKLIQKKSINPVNTADSSIIKRGGVSVSSSYIYLIPI